LIQLFLLNLLKTILFYIIIIFLNNYIKKY